MKGSLLTKYKNQKKINELKELLPEVFVGDKLDLAKLKASLGEDLLLDEKNYGLDWFGKNKSKELSASPINKKLKLNHAKSYKPLKTQNLFIEGDNLDALKLLRSEYSAKIKLIYIDPPYNKGKQFAYTDRFKQSSKDYLSYLNDNYPGRVDDSLKNRIESGEIHTAWLNMIYPRLILSKELLKEDGVIAISIDETEKSNTQILCNEIFGEENFVACLIWENRSISNDNELQYASTHEYILIYSKDRSRFKFKGTEKDFSGYQNPDEDPKGDWMRDNPTASSGNQNFLFPIVNPITGEEYLPPNGRYWAFSQSRVKEWTQSGKMVFPNETGKRFLLKKYKSELKNENKPIASIIQGITTARGTKELKELFPEGVPFQYPKPTELMMFLIDQCADQESVVLDLFAGSASMAHAIFKINQKESSSRKFICIQWKEELKNTQTVFKNMSEVTRERIIRASHHFSNVDNGFRFLEIE